MSIIWAALHQGMYTTMKFDIDKLGHQRVQEVARSVSGGVFKRIFNESMMPPQLDDHSPNLVCFNTPDDPVQKLTDQILRDNLQNLSLTCDVSATSTTYKLQTPCGHAQITRSCTDTPEPHVNYTATYFLASDV